MSGIELIGDSAPKLLNDLARHRMITRLYQDILMDLMVCEIEGWDKTEYIREIREAVNSIGEKNHEEYIN